MKPELKKLLILNAPYLLFVYLFDKIGQAVRLAPGADLSGKVLSLADGFSAAFATPLPSLAPMDLLIGIVGAVLIRLMVYFKGKNAKKYRKGIEYGSARWGNAEDIKPYTDPVFQNNVLLTQTERLTAYQQYGFSSPEELDEACSAAYTAMRESLTELKQVEKTLDGKKELQRQVLAYSKTRPVRDGLKQQKNAKAKAAYRQKHESDFIIADAAARYFRENGISKLPSYKALQAEIETLIKEKNSGYNDYRAKREEYRRLQTVKGNIDQILRRSEPQRRKEQSHER